MNTRTKSDGLAGLENLSRKYGAVPVTVAFGDGIGPEIMKASLTHKSISKTTFFWTILGRPAIKGHEAGRAQL